MFYRPGEEPDFPHNPFKAMIAPRPIGWISTVDAAGTVNLAPYSFFNAVADTPPVVMFAANGPHDEDGGLKDSARNAIETGEFVHNFVSFALRDAMNATSAYLPRDVNEFEVAGLTMAPCELVKAPRVAESPVSMECRTLQHVEMPSTVPGKRNVVVFGEVIGIHIADGVMEEGRFPTAKLQPLARCGYMDYAVVEEVFSLQRPGGRTS